MAKQLRDPVPSSSIVRLFDMQTAANAVAAVAPVPLPRTATVSPRQPVPPAVDEDVRPAAAPQPVPPAPSRPVFVKRELVLTPGADDTLTRLVDVYRRVTGAKVSASHVARAILRAIAFAMPAVEHQAARLGPMKLPSNASGRVIERERFEASLADAFIAGIRAAADVDES